MAAETARIFSMEGWRLRLERPLVPWYPRLWKNNPHVCSWNSVLTEGLTKTRSMIIDELKSSVSSPRSPVAFFYFDYRDQGRQTPSSLLLSFLRQIIAILPDLPNCIVDAHEKYPDSGDSLPLRELEAILHEISLGLRQVYLIIDALDECDESTHRKATIQLLDRIHKISNIYLFITSRQYPHDIKESLQGHPQIAIQANESDLRSYMYREIESSNVPEIDQEFASTIVDTLISRAHGM